MKHLRTLRMSFAVLAISLLPFAPVAPAYAGLVVNGSFENATATITTQFLTAGVSNWSNSNIGEALVLPSWYTLGLFPNVGLAGPFPQYSPDGGNFVLSDGDYMNSAITQTITGLTPGANYQLSFYQGLAQDTEPNITIPGPVSGRWQVTLGSSPSQLSSMMYADGSIPTISNWKQETMAFTAQNATELLSFFAIGTGDPPMVALDGVSLDATAPEPASFLLMGLGGALLGCGVFVRRRKAQAQLAKVV
jgi:hypothetical protein